MWPKLLLTITLLTLSIAAGPLHTSSRWILDGNGARFKMRCVNWAGHGEANIPEGLQHRPAEYIASWIADAGFNCVRLTYSTDMALDPDLSVRDSFTNAAANGGVPLSAMQDAYAKVEATNPWAANATVLGAFSAVITALDARGLRVVLDNHVSRAGWCCNTQDGNGWWSAAAGYDPANSRYFDADAWLRGLAFMADFSTAHPAVAGMSLRNELRAVGGQDKDGHADWRKFVTQGAQTVYDANPDLLIVIGGVRSAVELGFLREDPLDTSGWPERTVWEFHSYYWSYPGVSAQCDAYEAALGLDAGFLLEQGKPYTGPLWLSEFGFAQFGPSGFDPVGQVKHQFEEAYRGCLIGYLEGNDADWAVWALQGSYYIREGGFEVDEGYGMLDKEWKDWRSPETKGKLGKIFDMTEGP